MSEATCEAAGPRMSALISGSPEIGAFDAQVG